MYLIEQILRMMKEKKKVEKMRRGNFLEGVWLGGREEKCVVGLRYLLLGRMCCFFVLFNGDIIVNF